MLFVYTIFDPARDGHPLVTTVIDHTGKSKIYNLYLRGTGRKIYDVEQDIKSISCMITASECTHLNDCKQHLIAFKLDYTVSCKIYDHPISISAVPAPGEMKSHIAKSIISMKKAGDQEWMRIRGNAAHAYRHIQQRGVLFGFRPQYPVWHMDVYSGRTRATGFPIQGLQKGDPISNINYDAVFLHFDWISVDFRAASLLSGDELLNRSFDGSDPYQFLADHINEGVTDDKLTRDETKLEMFRSLYSFDTDSPVLEFYSGLRQWMVNTRENIRKNGYAESILGRRFTFRDDKMDDKPVLNAVLQGSVVHAMQLCIRTVWELYPDNILTENHDSLVVTCKAEQAHTVIKDIKDIMMHPFRGILEYDPLFPIEIGYSKVYKGWEDKKSRRFYE